MSEVDDEVKGHGDDGEKQEQQASTETVIIDRVVSIQQTDYELPECHKDNNDKKEKEGSFQAKNDDTLSTVRLLGEPLVAHGPYTFYGALGYRKRGDVTNKKRRRWKKQQPTESCDSSSSCCCSSVDADDSCSCSISSSRSEWSVVRMNHFYAVRPWYSIRNSSDRQQLRRRHRKHSSKLSTSTATVERSQHHYQQSVCIGELELLWRDDSIETTTPVPSLSLLKKRSSTRAVPLPSMTTSNGGGDDKIDAMTNNSNNDGDVAASSDEDDDSALLLPRRRTLPRRTRQPSAKKLEAAESCAAVAAAAVSDNHPLQQSLYHRSRQSTVPLSDPSSVAIPLSSPGAQYKHGNLLCSVRLYVMPDQTAAGRIGGVHGEDEVLEINTWNANGGIDRVFLNDVNSIGSIYNGGGVDDYGYGSGSHSSGTLPSGCSGLVLRAEDFVEWVRGGLMNDDDEIEDTESDNESLESESGDDQKPIKTKMPEQGDDQQPKLPTLVSDVESKVKQLEIVHDNDKTKVKLESTFTMDVVKKEEATTVDQSLLAIPINISEIKKEDNIATVVDRSNNFCTSVKEIHDGNCYLNSAVDEAVKAENVPLAAAKIHKKRNGDMVCRHDHRCSQHCRINCDSLVNGDAKDINIKRDHLDYENTIVGPKVDDMQENNQKADCKRHYRGSQNNDKKTKTYSGDSSKQKLVVMSYSRYCRYRAQLQRRREGQFSGDCTISNGDTKKVAITYQGVDTKTTTRVLFCRETYDYPAELLLEPFNAQQGHHQNATVLVNHMAPKLKGWPAYPASWMSFRWNRVRRRLRHLERGSGDNEDRRRRRRRRKLKKTCRQRQNETSGVAINYSSSTEDDYSDDSDSEDASSATNDAATNSTTTSSTSDSDGAPPSSTVIPKTVNKNHSSASLKVISGIHHNNKKNLSVPSTSSIIVINGATTVSAVANNKRNATATGQSGLQQLTKRRRVIYTTESKTQQQHQQQVLYQQQPQRPKPKQQHANNQQLEQFHQHGQSQRHQNMLVVQQQQPRLQSFNRRLPTPISSIQPSTTRVIHHHLPPSVTIMPVVVPTGNTDSHQQQQRFNNRLQNRQKQYSSAAILSAASQRRNNNSDRQQMPLPPVIIEYDDDDNHEYASDDNGRYKKSTIEPAMVACHRRVEQHGFEDEQRQQREEEERQRRWLVDALRLGGLEVTAVPQKVNTCSGNSSGSGNNRVNNDSELEIPELQLTDWPPRGGSFESLLSPNNEYNGGVEQHHGDDGDDVSVQESDSDSVEMTVTPDVVCILDKSQQHESVEKKHQQPKSRGDLTSTASVTMTNHPEQRRHSINLNNDDSSSGGDQQQHPLLAAAVALHDKISRAIDSLKQEQEYFDRVLSPTPPPRPVKSGNIIFTTSFHHPKRNNNSSMTSNATPTEPSIEITIIPVTESSTIGSTKLPSQQQKRSSSVTGAHNSIDGTETQSSSCSSFPKTIRQQPQQRNATATSSSASVSESILDMMCSDQNLQQQRISRSISLTMKSNSSQQQIIKIATVSESQHHNDKRKSQQNKKD